ncbi:unnamed protein product [Vitrella brassicaformis CCMP3155]|uniref:Uncharacterized protein n=2 Tax=Vitrella brassicaformis TaxID=1169539 RepID=A0A0G4FAS2_VITBC|nr:unnamed protein product [Vitrella brassicaformis CCMP3155]|mmetsp:Transcript_31247/g.90670  ORF Transcript_31247/g.90670 Transcript_31247/m.90670 type:complete len:352 (-) Transcript_31247:2502-3557(-)|eukprot:CEM09743.1 unnamed protein product [Vitrella brassicaformis CCMP3155]
MMLVLALVSSLLLACGADMAPSEFLIPSPFLESRILPHGPDQQGEAAAQASDVTPAPAADDELTQAANVTPPPAANDNAPAANDDATGRLSLLDKDGPGSLLDLPLLDALDNDFLDGDIIDFIFDLDEQGGRTTSLGSDLDAFKEGLRHIRTAGRGTPLREAELLASDAGKLLTDLSKATGVSFMELGEEVMEILQGDETLTGSVQELRGRLRDALGAVGEAEAEKVVNKLSEAEKVMSKLTGEYVDADKMEEAKEEDTNVEPLMAAADVLFGGDGDVDLTDPVKGRLNNVAGAVSSVLKMKGDDRTVVPDRLSKSLNEFAMRSNMKDDPLSKLFDLGMELFLVQKLLPTV